MGYSVHFFITAAVLVQQALASPAFNLFQPLYHGAQALPVVKHDGFLADTHQVTAAKNAHLAAVAAHAHQEHHEYPAHHDELPLYHNEHSIQHHDLQAQALPVVKHDGFLADTHEVAAAKNAHLAAVAAHAHQEHHEYPAHHDELPLHHNEHSVQHHDLPVHQEHQVLHHEYPAHHNGLPLHHNEHSFQHHDLPVHQEHQILHHEYLAHHNELPLHHNEHSIQHHDLPVHKELSVHHGQEYVQKYHGPIALPVVLHNGHLADTPEVALEKSHHLGAVAQAKADKYYSGHQEYGYGGSYGYSGSHHGYGIPVVLPNGHIADTHEVAAAKSAHLLAVAKAKADKYYSGHGEGYGYGGGYGYSSSYRGYGIPVVLPNGHLADTHEVAAAKAAHLSAVAHAKAEQAHSHYHHDEHEHHVEHHEPLTYYVPHHLTHDVPQVAHNRIVAHDVTHGHPQSFANVWLIE